MASELIKDIHLVSFNQLGLAPRSLISVDQTIPVQQISVILHDNNILCVPVYDHSQDKWIGLIDTLELLKLNAVEYNAHYLKENKLEELSLFFPSLNLSDKTVIPALFTAGDLIKQSDRAKNIHVFDAGDTMDTVMKVLTLYEHHRILVRKRKKTESHPGQQRTEESTQGPKDPANDYFMVTQTDIVRWLFKTLQHDSKLQERASRTLQDLKIAQKKVLSLSCSSKAIEGFSMLDFHKVSAIPVQNQLNQLVGTVSASDLRGIHVQKLIPLLGLNVMQFIKEVTGSSFGNQITVTPKDTLLNCMEKILKAEVHRAWVIDEDEHLLGVVTLTDIIKTFIWKHV